MRFPDTIQVKSEGIIVSLESAVLVRACEHATAYLQGLDTRSVATTVGLVELRKRLNVGLGAEGTPPETVIDELVAATAGGQLGSASGRFFAWVIGGALPSALAADWLASTWDVNATMYACGPAAAVTEEIAGEWIKDVLDLPRDASFAFTTGCQLAHMTCLAAARHAVLDRAGWDVELDGLVGAPPVRVLATEERHGSIERALRFLGLGTRSLIPLATGDDGRLRANVLSDALAAGTGPTIVVLDAADLNIGACDPFAELIPLARHAGAWVHVDGAFGLWARASREHRHLVDGVELADSWATDAHKWLNTPQDNGIAIVRDRAAHRAAMTLAAHYLVAGGEARDAIDWTPDWTRRARGYAVYAALRELGRDGLAAMIDGCCRHASALAWGIGDLDGVELVAAPTLNQGLVRFLDPHGRLDVDHDRHTDAVISAINSEGTAFFSGTLWRGRRAMRISVVNWRTSDDDVRATVDAVERVLSQINSTS
ncbi:pyridoxal phosphate-dependent decarboxylase family protein [Paraburkholderia panacisoli]|uniref:pyridoxal phosphate-dependent decarboxylase family protein n=1 Tax=Paraburkholderia panacisoli TaxID=2603818 RepID=UPI001FE707B6|nr:pyridoxal-dependent decarboxylase [Paraburkholderia panacisoli]